MSATRVAPVALIVLLPPAASAFMVRYGGALPTVMQRPCPAALAPSSSMLADAAVASPDMITSLQQFQDSHSILIATLSAVAVRVVLRLEVGVGVPLVVHGCSPTGGRRLCLFV